MIASLSAALQGLKARLAEHPDSVPVLSSEDLEGQFHGLSVSQVARLVDAPALACLVGREADPDGHAVHYQVEGADEALKSQAARRLLLETELPADSEAALQAALADMAALLRQQASTEAATRH